MQQSQENQENSDKCSTANIADIPNFSDIEGGSEGGGGKRKEDYNNIPTIKEGIGALQKILHTTSANQALNLVVDKARYESKIWMLGGEVERSLADLEKRYRIIAVNKKITEEANILAIELSYMGEKKFSKRLHTFIDTVSAALLTRSMLGLSLKSAPFNLTAFLSIILIRPANKPKFYRLRGEACILPVTAGLAALVKVQFKFSAVSLHKLMDNFMRNHKLAYKFSIVTFSALPLALLERVGYKLSLELESKGLFSTFSAMHDFNNRALSILNFDNDPIMQSIHKTLRAIILQENISAPKVLDLALSNATDEKSFMSIIGTLGDSIYYINIVRLGNDIAKIRQKIERLGQSEKHTFLKENNIRILGNYKKLINLILDKEVKADYSKLIADGKKVTEEDNENDSRPYKFFYTGDENFDQEVLAKLLKNSRTRINQLTDAQEKKKEYEKLFPEDIDSEGSLLFAAFTNNYKGSESLQKSLLRKVGGIRPQGAFSSKTIKPSQMNEAQEITMSLLNDYIGVSDKEGLHRFYKNRNNINEKQLYISSTFLSKALGDSVKNIYTSTNFVDFLIANPVLANILELNNLEKLFHYRQGERDAIANLIKSLEQPEKGSKNQSISIPMLNALTSLHEIADLLSGSSGGEEREYTETAELYGLNKILFAFYKDQYNELLKLLSAMKKTSIYIPKEVEYIKNSIKQSGQYTERNGVSSFLFGGREDVGMIYYMIDKAPLRVTQEFINDIIWGNRLSIYFAYILNNDDNASITGFIERISQITAKITIPNAKRTDIDKEEIRCRYQCTERILTLFLGVFEEHKPDGPIHEKISNLEDLASALQDKKTPLMAFGGSQEEAIKSFIKEIRGKSKKDANRNIEYSEACRADLHLNTSLTLHRLTCSQIFSKGSEVMDAYESLKWTDSSRKRLFRCKNQLAKKSEEYMSKALTNLFSDGKNLSSVRSI